MKAAVFHGDGVLRIEERPEPGVEAPDDVIVAVEACGVCGTDLQILNVPPGHPADPGVVMGHEFIGRIAAAGSEAQAAGLQAGQRVAVDPDPKCGVCRYCRAGRPVNCLNIRALGIFRDGALTSLVKAPANAVFPLADGPRMEVAALIEPLACVVNGASKANPRPGESAVIFGAGAIGCLFLAVFRASGAGPVFVVEPSPDRRKVADAVGADETLAPDEFAARRPDLLPEGADLLVDAVGTQFGSAVEHAALGARIVLFGQNQNARPPIHQYSITERSLSVFGSYITNFTFPTAIRMVESGALRLEPIVTHVLPLDQTLAGLDLLRSGQATKVVVLPQ